MVKLFVRDLLPALDNEDRRLIDSVLDDVIEWLHERYAEARDYVLKCDQSSAMFDDLGPLAEGGKPN